MLTNSRWLLGTFFVGLSTLIGYQGPASSGCCHRALGPGGSQLAGPVPLDRRIVCAR